jgi:predicted dehydrogenase
VSAENAQAIAKAARQAKIQVLVNYETTWYPSNHAAYDLVRQKAIGEIRKIVVHDGHQGPKEIGVGPEFLGWLTDPKLDGGGAQKFPSD